MNELLKMIRSNIFTGIVMFLGIVLFCSSCTKEDQVNTFISDTSGNWKVSLYFDNTDETNHYTGYSFAFNNGGGLVATNGINTVTGSWSQTSTKFIINFGTTSVFEELNDDWLIVEKTASSIKLKDDNPAQDDRLNFVKL